MKKKVCVVTGTRAEYGILKPLIKAMEDDPELELLLYVTGAHLAAEFGYTCREIEEDRIKISRKIDMQLDSGTPRGILRSIGTEAFGFADALTEDQPDLMVILGDRYEIMMAAVSAMIFRVPIAHIHGGELTEGAIDDAIRHSITKMSCIHFAATEEYRKRIIQLGEQPGRVYNVGALGVENCKKIKRLDRQGLEEQLSFSLDGTVALVTYHPVTLEGEECGINEFRAILDALKELRDIKVIFTKANADAGGKVINDMIDAYVEENRQHCRSYYSLGQLRYLSLLPYCAVVIGNSSSGIVEAPSFHVPTVNVGNRQKGRVYADSVIHCNGTRNEILEAIRKALSDTFRETIRDSANPYENERTTERIMEIIKSNLNEGIELKKTFYDIGGEQKRDE